MTDRCRCRPGCLAWLTVDDDIVLTKAGYALTDHVLGAYPQEQLPMDVGQAS